MPTQSRWAWHPPLFVAWYNFCRPQMTLGTTPAVAAGLASETWATERLLSESAKVAIA